MGHAMRMQNEKGESWSQGAHSPETRSDVQTSPCRPARVHEIGWCKPMGSRDRCFNEAATLLGQADCFLVGQITFQEQLERTDFLI